MTAIELPPQAIALVKHFEGCKLDSYTDAAGVCTVGYGHTEKVRPGASITPELADEFLRRDLNTAQADVLRCVKVPLNENENAALVSLAFNIGGPAFARSTCVKLLNRGDRKGAADEMQRFVKARVNGKLVTLKGLEMRRKAERDLFLCAPGEEANDGYLFVADHAIPLTQQITPVPPVRNLALAQPKSRPVTIKQIAVAAGIGGGVGAVPALNQFADAWKSAGGPDLHSAVNNWTSAFNRWLMSLPHAADVRAVADNFGQYLQAHQMVALALTALGVYLLRSAIARLRSA
jgi:lysozyme